ncbi:MAG: 50S ribosomal protein L23 [Candidatus Karelsulcia muelleri]|uniref:50S ribosomal protein L23 n=1 Tax=Candidatus Karelsulcia muelleri TaxID=336810 RepID=UPI000D7C4292|nr:50S ribosomal protein L23 [Candidatus Karelsulcia muelleri]
MLINIKKKFSNKKLDPFFTFKVPLFYNKKEIKKLIYKIYNINFNNIKTMIYCNLKKSKKGVLKINKFKKVILKLKQDYKFKIFNKLKIKANLEKFKIFNKLKINYNLDKLKILNKLKNFSSLELEELLKIFNKLKKYFNYFNLGILKNFNKFKKCSQLERLKIFNQLKKSFNLSNIKETKLN